MNFVERFFHHVEGAPSGALLVEMHGAEKRPVDNATLAGWIAGARGTLRDRGVGAGDRVVLLAPNSARWAAADLAVLAEGAIVVPMYARQAMAELVEMMRDCEPRLVVVPDDPTAAHVRESWPEAAPVVTLATLFAGEPVEAPPRPLNPEDTVTIIYTSGTSGVPKGVMLDVGNVDFMLPVTADRLDRLMAGRRARAPHAADVVYHYLPFCFAGSRVVLWTCLWRGNPIHVSTDLDRIREELPAVRPNYFLNVPTLLERIRNGVEERLAGQPAPIRALYEAGRAAHGRLAAGDGGLVDRATLALARAVVLRKIKQQVGPELEGLICGSAPLGEETQRWFELLGIPVYQVYGLTETTAIVTMDEPGRAVPGRVGAAIPGCRVRLGDEDELQCQGRNVFAGYWRKDAETTAAFTDDGWFRSGDAAEVDAAGNYRIVGRTKNLLVPESGHNVAPEPIEQRLLESLPGAEHVVLFGHGRPYLVAVVSGSVDAATVEEKVAALNADLPHYRRVRKWHVTGEPFTPDNGLVTANMKLRRRALEAHFADVLDGMYAR